MIGARPLDRGTLRHDQRRGLGDVAAPRGHANLVGDHPQQLPLARQLLHGTQEIAPTGAVHPPHPQQQMRHPGGLHGQVAG